jgi:hypothetical protein
MDFWKWLVKSRSLQDLRPSIGERFQRLNDRVEELERHDALLKQVRELKNRARTAK